MIYSVYVCKRKLCHYLPQTVANDLWPVYTTYAVNYPVNHSPSYRSPLNVMELSIALNCYWISVCSHAYCIITGPKQFSCSRCGDNVTPLQPTCQMLHRHCSALTYHFFMLNLCRSVDCPHTWRMVVCMLLF